MKKIIIHNKLVRDKIPNILFKKNISCITKVLTPYEYEKELNKKLQEEVKELLNSKNLEEWLEEMADVYEVLLALLKNKQISLKALESVRKNKAISNGTFEQRIFLEKTVSVV